MVTQGMQPLVLNPGFLIVSAEVEELPAPWWERRGAMIQVNAEFI
jgi:hypothetical protein